MSPTSPEIPRRVFLQRLVIGSLSTALVCNASSQEVLARGAFVPREGNGVNESIREYAFVIDVEKCIGCGKCVVACKEENQVPDEVTRTWVERYVATNAGIYVDSPKAAIDGFPEEAPAEVVAGAKWAAFVPKLCNHCKEPPCVQVCPVGATFRSPDGFVLVDPEHCIACGYCVQGCPYGARFINPVRRIADKCTWCYHRIIKGLLPACVTVCPTGARQFGSLNDPKSPAAKVFAADNYSVLKPNMHTRSMCFYLNLPREVI
uniref:Tetrathionate reductase beta subunit n=1 Tax=Candidatus Kentrum sp. MB TaxID=2138164 RepID=A0A450X1U1_9GAMM|nr:MAG: tetrathionate reductase beta subunit [Candidatus Kentron sp. MB]VFK28395.1 MAG: tetrathionate reductase beta subunit [Candidatus Kentron sp. MB]VFK74233.1 MAG: tetrathionate reductase beta subunit [Candidatus Kentron sp. MB]